MTMRSPVHAMLWENWRLTRVEAAWHLALGIVAASAVLAVFAAVPTNEAARDFGAVIALTLIVMPNILGWFSINNLNVERPGFPFYLLYTRPVRTAVAVGVPMAYWAAASAALYLVSALLLRITSGYAFPLLSVAAWIAALNLSSTAVNWSIRNLVVRILAGLAVAGAWSGLAMHVLIVDEIPGPDLAPPHLWPTVFDSPLTYYVMAGAIGLASFGLTVAAVARQRRGDWRTDLSYTPGAGFPDRLVSLFRLPCPTSSATRAQVWFELRSRGLPILTIGVALAIVIPLLFVVTTRLDVMLSWVFTEPITRSVAMVVAMFSLPTVLVLGGNAFGIRRRQGRTYTSAFDATQASGTARMAGLKVLVRSVCLLAALAAVGTSIWTSASIIPFDVLHDNDTFIDKSRNPVSGWMRAIEGAVVAMNAYQQLALAVVASIGVVVWVVSWAALGALVTRYPRRVNRATSLVLLYGLALVLLALADNAGSDPRSRSARSSGRRPGWPRQRSCSRLDISCGGGSRSSC